MACLPRQPHVVALHRPWCPFPPRSQTTSSWGRVRLHNVCSHSDTRCRGYRTVVLAQRQTEKDKPNTQAPSSITTQQDEEPKWGLFDGKAYLQPWQVPWGGKELTLGMVGWGVTFLLVGLAFIPIARTAAGPEGFASLSQTDKAWFALANQVAETLVGVGVVRAAVRGFELPSDILRIDFSEPFKKPNGWAFWALMGVSLAPLVVYVSSVAFDSLGYDGVSGRGTVDAVSQIISLNGATYAALFGTTAILAPILEETVFRGFLLVSLTKWLPVPVAVLISGLAFGLVHFTPKDFPQLTALGVLLGLSYVRSRNLLTPMIIHGAWNGTVLSILYFLTSMGVDIDKLIHSAS